MTDATAEQKPPHLRAELDPTQPERQATIIARTPKVRRRVHLDLERARFDALGRRDRQHHLERTGLGALKARHRTTCGNAQLERTAQWRRDFAPHDHATRLTGPSHRGSSTRARPAVAIDALSVAQAAIDDASQGLMYRSHQPR